MNSLHGLGLLNCFSRLDRHWWRYRACARLRGIGCIICREGTQRLPQVGKVRHGLAQRNDNVLASCAPFDEFQTSSTAFRRIIEMHELFAQWLLNAVNDFDVAHPADQLGADDL